MNKSAPNDRASVIIKALSLKPHPEGGFFSETYRADGTIPASELPSKYGGNRSYCTGIYFLLRGQDFSAFHRVTSDEMWHFYEGSPVAIFHIEGDRLVKTIVGPVGVGVPQFVVPGGAWFAAEPVQKDGYSLVGCTVAPGFDFADFELADREELIRQWPQFAPIIESMTISSSHMPEYNP